MTKIIYTGEETENNKKLRQFNDVQYCCRDTRPHTLFHPNPN